MSKNATNAAREHLDEGVSCGVCGVHSALLNVKGSICNLTNRLFALIYRLRRWTSIKHLIDLLCLSGICSRNLGPTTIIMIPKM